MLRPDERASVTGNSCGGYPEADQHHTALLALLRPDERATVPRGRTVRDLVSYCVNMLSLLQHRRHHRQRLSPERVPATNDDDEATTRGLSKQAWPTATQQDTQGRQVGEAER